MNFKIETPNKKQMEFFKQEKRFIAYGGSRGGGKSWAVRKKAILLALRYFGIKILILRKTFTELRENHIIPFLAEVGKFTNYKELEKAINFPNGSRIKFGYCDCDTDINQYQGQEYDIIFLDEATHFKEQWFRMLTACNRGANDFPKRMYLTCNPGGVGHAWVKRLFIDKQYKGNEKESDYVFIPAKVYDNKVLMEKDPAYIESLKSLPEALKRAWLDGDWDVFEGQYFPEFNRDIHVVKPFEIPKQWKKYFAMDYGLDMFAGYVIAINDRGISYVCKEYCQSNLLISDACIKIKELTKNDVIEGYIAPPDMWNRRQDTGKSVAEMFSESGIYLQKAQNDRVTGWLEVKEWLKPFDSVNGSTAKLQIFENCRELIRCLPLLQYDTTRINDVANEPHEITHSPDALRYFITSRPSSGNVLFKENYGFNEWDSLLDYG